MKLVTKAVNYYMVSKDDNLSYSYNYGQPWRWSTNLIIPQIIYSVKTIN